jgi:hypothetical protein
MPWMCLFLTIISFENSERSHALLHLIDMLIKAFQKFRINSILNSPRILNNLCCRLAKYNVMKVLNWYTVYYN